MASASLQSASATQSAEERRALVAKLRERKSSRSSAAAAGHEIDGRSANCCEHVSRAAAASAKSSSVVTACAPSDCAESFGREATTADAPQVTGAPSMVPHRPPTELSERQARLRSIKAKRTARSQQVADAHCAGDEHVSQSNVEQRPPSDAPGAAQCERQARLAALRAKREARSALWDEPISHDHVAGNESMRDLAVADVASAVKAGTSTSVTTKAALRLAESQLQHHAEDEAGNASRPPAEQQETLRSHRSVTAFPPAEQPSVRESPKAHELDPSDVGRDARRARVEAMRARCASRERAQNRSVPLDELLDAASHAQQGDVAGVDNKSAVEGAAKQKGGARSAAQRRMDHIRLSQAAREEERRHLEQQSVVASQTIHENKHVNQEVCAPSQADNEEERRHPAPESSATHLTAHGEEQASEASQTVSRAVVQESAAASQAPREEESSANLPDRLAASSSKKKQRPPQIVTDLEEESIGGRLFIKVANADAAVKSVSDPSKSDSLREESMQANKDATAARTAPLDSATSPSRAQPVHQESAEAQLNAQVAAHVESNVDGASSLSRTQIVCQESAEAQLDAQVMAHAASNVDSVGSPPREQLVCQESVEEQLNAQVAALAESDVDSASSPSRAQVVCQESAEAQLDEQLMAPVASHAESASSPPREQLVCQESTEAPVGSNVAALERAGSPSKALPENAESVGDNGVAVEGANSPSGAEFVNGEGVQIDSDGQAVTMAEKSVTAFEGARTPSGLKPLNGDYIESREDVQKMTQMGNSVAAVEGTSNPSRAQSPGERDARDAPDSHLADQSSSSSPPRVNGENTQSCADVQICALASDTSGAADNATRPTPQPMDEQSMANDAAYHASVSERVEGMQLTENVHGVAGGQDEAPGQRHILLQQLKAKRAARDNRRSYLEHMASEDHETSETKVALGGIHQNGRGRSRSQSRAASRVGSASREAASRTHHDPMTTLVCHAASAVETSPESFDDSSEKQKITAEKAALLDLDLQSPGECTSYAAFHCAQRQKQAGTINDSRSDAASTSFASAFDSASDIEREITKQLGIKVQDVEPEKSRGDDRRSRIARIHELQRARGATLMPVRNVSLPVEEPDSPQRPQVSPQKPHEADETPKVMDEEDLITKVAPVEDDEYAAPQKKVIVLGPDHQQVEACTVEPEPELQADGDQEASALCPAPVMPRLPAHKPPELFAPPEAVQDIKHRYKQYLDTTKECNDSTSQQHDGHAEGRRTAKDDALYEELQAKWRELRGGMTPEDIRPELKALMSPLEIKVDFGVKATRVASQEHTPTSKSKRRYPDATSEDYLSPPCFTARPADPLFVRPDELPRLLGEAAIPFSASPPHLSPQRDAGVGGAKGVSPRRRGLASSAVVPLPSLGRSAGSAERALPLLGKPPKDRQRENCVQQ